MTYEFTAAPGLIQTMLFLRRSEVMDGSEATDSVTNEAPPCRSRASARDGRTVDTIGHR